MPSTIQKETTEGTTHQETRRRRPFPAGESKEETAMKNCKALCLAFALLLGLLSGCQGTQEPQEPADGNPQLAQAAQELLAESGQPSDPQQTQQVAQDLQLLSGTVLRELVRVEEITQEGVTYAIDYPAAGVTDLLQVAAQEDGSTTVTITEGEKTDVFTYQTNGKVLLNGETLSGCELIAGEEAPEQDGLVCQVEAAPAEQISQTADRAENIVAGTDYTFLNLAAQVHTVSLPAPAEELTLSALLHVLGSHGANRLQQIMANPAAAGLVNLRLAAACQQTAEQEDRGPHRFHHTFRYFCLPERLAADDQRVIFPFRSDTQMVQNALHGIHIADARAVLQTMHAGAAYAGRHDRQRRVFRALDPVFSAQRHAAVYLIKVQKKHLPTLLSYVVGAFYVPGLLVQISVRQRISRR